MKSLIFLKTVALSVPAVLSVDISDTITNPYDVAKTFNNYFASIAEKKNHINIFQTILQIKVIVHYFCNLLTKKK